MTLPELVTPIFAFAIEFRRKLRQNEVPDYSDVKRTITSLFTRVEALAATHALTDRWARAKIALTYLVDELAIMEEWAGQEDWNNHCLEIEYLGHDEKMRGAWFFDREYTHALETSDMELMDVLYTCMCLGFEGKFRGQATQLRNHLDNLFSRLPIPLADEDDPRMFKECYEIDPTSNDPRSLMRMATAVTIFVGIVAMYVVVSQVMYTTFTDGLTEVVGKLTN